jgi:hypothetical protein
MLKLKLFVVSIGLPALSYAAVCSSLSSRTEVFNGKSYTKYNIVDSSSVQCSQVQATFPKMPWKVKKTSWSAQDESTYSQFIKKLGNSKCNTVDKCLAGNDNILRTEEDMLFTHYSDCADFPYYLRAYFAYKQNLPFSMVSSVDQAPFTDKQRAETDAERARILAEKGQAEVDKYNARVSDERYSRNGNIPTGRSNVPASNGSLRDFSVYGPRIIDTISSGTMRMLNGAGGYVESDFYSPKVIAQSIKVGTVLYNVSGHVAIVYDIMPDGRILFFDAHPDNSVTRGFFNPEFQLVKSVYGGNFKNFRPIEVLNPEMDADGNIVKGQIAVASDQAISDFSLEQYNGNGPSQNGKPVFKLNLVDAKGVNFYDWVKFRISGGLFKLDPLNEMKNEMGVLCNMTQDRIATIQVALDNQIHLKPHPSNLPQNIFGADGEWEAYSSPSRDLRLKQKVLAIPEEAKLWMKRYFDRDPLISYTGQNLKQDLIQAYTEQVGLCKITYTNSMKQKVTLGLAQLINRIARISYDPYDCPELRWGADNQAERSTCTNDQEKMEWYNLQQFLRNNLEKDTAAVQGWSLEELASMNEHQTVNNNNSSESYKIDSKLKAL